MLSTIYCNKENYCTVWTRLVFMASCTKTKINTANESDDHQQEGGAADRRGIDSIWAFTQKSISLINKSNTIQWLVLVVLTCQWCHTCQSAAGCSFPSVFAAPSSDPLPHCPQTGDACSPGRCRTGFYMVHCHRQEDNLEGKEPVTADGKVNKQ